jgi:hypothetical protein
MTRIEEILQADAIIARAAIEILKAFDSDLLGTIEAAGGLFEAYNDCVGASFSDLDSEGDRRLSAIAERLGSPPADLIRRLRTDEAGRDEARTLWQAMKVREAKKFALLLLHRYFRWGLSNILYLRVTPALGYGRLQAEATALLHLFRDEPSRAEEWLVTGLSEEAGKKFYKATQGTIRELLKRHGLTGEYERGSAAYQHVRLNSATRALSITDAGTRLADQEFNPDRPGEYYRVVLWFLSVQVKAFAALLTGVPEVQCDGWRDRVEVFARRVDALWRVLERRFTLEDEEPD